MPEEEYKRMIIKSTVIGFTHVQEECMMRVLWANLLVFGFGPWFLLIFITPPNKCFRLCAGVQACFVYIRFEPD
jgi:hypothetical protein